MRVSSGVPVDPYYGSLLAEPVGYPNAMGVLAAIGASCSRSVSATGPPESVPSAGYEPSHPS